MLTETREPQVDDLLARIEQALDVASAAVGEDSTTALDLPGRSKIMMVDDEELNILVVAEYLKSDGYRDLISTDNPLRALSLMARERPDAVLLDFHMPHLDGFGILQQIRADKELARTPVIILTASTDDDVKLRALKMGATDFLHKPIHGGELLARLRNILMAKIYQDHWRNYSQSLETAVRERTAELAASRRDVIHCLARAAEYRDDDTGHHVIRVGRYARVIAGQLGLEANALDVLEQAAKLHDIGKIGIPDAILLKAGKLAPEQFEVIQKHCGYGKQLFEQLPSEELERLRRHTELGARILDEGRSPILALAMKIALTHHERWDGAGYPLGLAGRDIPLEGRITAVADVFDALSTKRPYKPAFPLEKCFAIMAEGRGTHFDPDVLDAFFARRDEIVQIQIAYAEVR